MYIISLHISASVLPIKSVSFTKTFPDANAVFVSFAKYFTCGKNIIKYKEKSSPFKRSSGLP